MALATSLSTEEMSEKAVRTVRADNSDTLFTLQLIKISRARSQKKAARMHRLAGAAYAYGETVERAIQCKANLTLDCEISQIALSWEATKTNPRLSNVTLTHSLHDHCCEFFISVAAARVAGWTLGLRCRRRAACRRGHSV